MLVRFATLLLVAIALFAGCQLGEQDKLQISLPSQYTDIYSQQNIPIQEPINVESQSFSQFDAGPLQDFNFDKPENYSRLELEQCIHFALQNSPVIRDLGGLVLTSPQAITSVHDTAIVYSDPRFGEEAALSEFDAVYTNQFLFQNNDQLFNNTFIGQGGVFQQKLGTFRTGLSKLAATGAEFQVNQTINYDLNNSPANQFNNGGSRSHSYDAFIEGRVRQPLFQGAGATFNRIAGPNNAPGVNNGVLIARANTDITLAEFESSVRDLISDVENAYWDLYFAYRDLEAKIEARDGAYRLWQLADNDENKNAAETGQAKEQYYRFAADVEDAIYGKLNDGTRTNNGSFSGTFRRNGGVRTAERRLRLISGMPLNESKLIIPADTPIEANTVFDWQTSKTDALARRPELRKQRWQYKKSQMELLASRNYLLPRIDLIGAYRFRGFGRDLFGDNGFDAGAPLDSSAFGTLADASLQEWELGFDVNIPVGFRRQHAAVRAGELNCIRARDILAEQERNVIFGLSNSIGELTRSSRVREASQLRYAAAVEQFSAIQVLEKNENTSMDLVLEAQRRVIEAKLQYFQSQVEYMLAIKSVHFEKGTLFDYHNVTLNESQWNQRAQSQAAGQVASKSKTLLNNAKSGLQAAKSNKSARKSSASTADAKSKRAVGSWFTQTNSAATNPKDERPTKLRNPLSSFFQRATTASKTNPSTSGGVTTNLSSNSPNANSAKSNAKQASSRRANSTTSQQQTAPKIANSEQQKPSLFSSLATGKSAQPRNQKNAKTIAENGSTAPVGLLSWLRKSPAKKPVKVQMTDTSSAKSLKVQLTDKSTAKTTGKANTSTSKIKFWDPLGLAKTADNPKPDQPAQAATKLTDQPEAPQRSARRVQNTTPFSRLR